MGKQLDFERDLEEDLQNDTSGQFKRLMVSQCNAGRSEDGIDDVDMDKAEEDAQTIYDVWKCDFQFSMAP